MKNWTSKDQFFFVPFHTFYPTIRLLPPLLFIFPTLAKKTLKIVFKRGRGMIFKKITLLLGYELENKTRKK